MPSPRKTTNEPAPGQRRQAPAAAGEPPAAARRPEGQAAPDLHPPADQALTARQLRAALADPFPAACVGWKPQAAKGDRALAVPYIDARDVMDRLDEVVGVDGWRPDPVEHADGTVTCTLWLRMPWSGEWLPKTDVGGESEQKDVGDRKKAAYSDALKRAAVQWGIGRYLYSVPSDWAGYDEKRRAFVRTPALPAWALPGGSGRPPGYVQAPPATPPPQEQEQASAHSFVKTEQAPQQQAETDPTAWLKAKDAQLSAESLSRPGALLAHVKEMWQIEGGGWSECYGKARKWAADFERNARQQKARA